MYDTPCLFEKYKGIDDMYLFIYGNDYQWEILMTRYVLSY